MKTRLVADFCIEDGPIDEDGEYQPDLAKYRQVIVPSVEDGAKIIGKHSITGDGRIYTEIKQRSNWDRGWYWSTDDVDVIEVIAGKVQS